MKLIIRHSILLILLALLISASEHNNYCEVFGAIYITTSKNQADYKVYIEDSEAFADMLIFKEENALFADESGKWFFVKDRQFSEYTIYFTTKEREADFSIYYTQATSFVGCN